MNWPSSFFSGVPSDRSSMLLWKYSGLSTVIPKVLPWPEVPFSRLCFWNRRITAHIVINNMTQVTRIHKRVVIELPLPVKLSA